ncbi:hypothetical protein [Erwinia tasmaniensis]|uniref:hypothetical protein n=1 Tax=Erwinia tasmaniensis TaxID=338565 RepID=UPI003A4DF8F7
MKTILILAKTEHSRTPYDVWLKDTGINLVLITSEKFFNAYASRIKHCFYLKKL